MQAMIAVFALVHLASVQAQTPPRPGEAAVHAFAQDAAEAVYKVIAFDREAFYLGLDGVWRIESM